jgi:hypothetical protein
MTRILEQATHRLASLALALGVTVMTLAGLDQIADRQYDQAWLAMTQSQIQAQALANAPAAKAIPNLSAPGA